VSAKARAPHPFKIEVEVTTLAELEEAIDARADIVLPRQHDAPPRSRSPRSAPHAPTCSSRSPAAITLATIGDYARAGCDLISVGALTHSAPAVDLGLDVRK